MIFGRTDLRKGVSEAKFDGQADGDVKKCLAPPKSADNHSKVANRPKRVFPKFRADRSQVLGANERSKFEFLWSNTFEYVAAAGGYPFGSVINMLEFTVLLQE